MGPCLTDLLVTLPGSFLEGSSGDPTTLSTINLSQFRPNSWRGQRLCPAWGWKVRRKTRGRVEDSSFIPCLSPRQLWGKDRLSGAGSYLVNLPGDKGVGAEGEDGCFCAHWPCSGMTIMRSTVGRGNFNLWTHRDLAWNPVSATNVLCDICKITRPLWLSFPSVVKWRFIVFSL